MKNSLIPLTMVVLLAWNPVMGASDPVAPALALLKQGEYRKGTRALMTLIKDRSVKDGQRLSALDALARFYMDDVGDHDRAKRYFKQILTTGNPEQGSQLKATARNELDRLARLQEKYRDLDTMLQQMKVAAFQPGKIESGDRKNIQGAVVQLKQILKKYPDYYRRHELYYVLGLQYMKLEKHWLAFRMFERAAALKAAMNLSQPVDRFSNSARSSWIRQFGRQAAWVTAGLLLAILWAGGLWSRPWQWVRFRHLLVGLILVLLWLGVFFAFYTWEGKTRFAAELVNRDGFYPRPTYVHTTPGTPGSDAAGNLLGFGLTAVLTIFFFTLITARIRRRSWAFGLNIGLACLLVLSLSTLYYLDHCDFKSRLYTRQQAATGWLDGYLAFRLNDPEPFLLTDPIAYRGIELASVSDPLLIKWLEKYQ